MFRTEVSWALCILNELYLKVRGTLTIPGNRAAREKTSLEAMQLQEVGIVKVCSSLFEIFLHNMNKILHHFITVFKHIETLVGGFNHLKNISQIGSFSQIGMNTKKHLKPPPRTQWVTVSPRVPPFPSAHSSLLCTITQLLSLRLTQVTYGWKTWPSNHFKDPGTVTMRLAAAVTPSNIHKVLSYHVGIDGWSRLLWFVHCMASTQRVALGIFWLFKTSLAWNYVIFSLQAFHQVLGSTSTIIVSFWSVCLRFFWVPPSAALFSCWFTL